MAESDWREERQWEINRMPQPRRAFETAILDLLVEYPDMKKPQAQAILVNRLHDEASRINELMTVEEN